MMRQRAPRSIPLSGRTSSLYGWVLLLGLGWILSTQLLGGPEERHYDIPEGMAIETLLIIAEESDTAILFSEKTVKNFRTQAVRAFLTLDRALGIMLENTPLEAVPVSNGRAYAILSRAEKGGEVPERSENESKKPPTKEQRKQSEMNLPTNESKKASGGLLKGLLALAVASTPNLSAQDGVDEIFELDPFEIDGSNQSGVRASQSISATRIATALNELPFAVNVITEQVIEDLSVTDVKDIVQFAGNVVAGEGTEAFGTTTNNSVRLRGFPTTQNLINGFSVGTDFFIAPNSIQRIETVKGPASLLYGAIPPGGIINFITKKPRAEAGGHVRYTMGSWNFNRVDVESTGPLSNNIRYLVNVSQEDRDFYWVGQEREALNILSAVEMDFAERKGNILLEYTHSNVDQSAVQAGTPLKNGTDFGPNGRVANELDLEYPVKNFNIRDGGAPQTKELDSIFLKFRYWFNENYTLRIAYRKQEGDEDRINQAVGGLPVFIDERPGRTVPQPGDADYGRTAIAQWDHLKRWDNASNYQINLLASYDLEWGSFQIMPGIDLNDADGWFWRVRAGTVGENGRRNGNFRSQPKNIFNPGTWRFDAPHSNQYLVDDPRTPEYEGPGLLRNSSGNDGSSEEYYVYGSGKFLDDKLIFTAGYRNSKFENAALATNEVLIPSHSSEILPDEKIDGKDSIYQLGVLFKVKPDGLHIYGNYAQSFQPQLRNILLPDPDGNPLDVDLDGDGILDSPELNDNRSVPAEHLFGEGWEVGVKGSLLENRVDFAVGYFTTTNNNIIRTISVPNDPDRYLKWFPNINQEIANLLPIDERLDAFQIQSGEEEASGIEMEFTITPVERWEIRTTFTHLKAELVSDEESPEAEGRRLNNSPEYMFNLFSRYAFGGNLEGFFIGGSADYLSERFSAPAQSGSAGVRARGRTLFNAFAGYRFGVEDIRYRLQLNVQNATDEFVLQGNHLGAFYPPRSYRFSAGIEFQRNFLIAIEILLARVSGCHCP